MYNIFSSKKCGLPFMILFLTVIVTGVPRYAFAEGRPAMTADQQTADGHAVQLSLEQATALALENNFDIQLIKYDTLISRTREGEAESIYDTIMDAQIRYNKSKLARTSSILGTKTYQHDYDVGLKKKLPTGTTVKLAMTNQRDWTDSSFASLNPAHESTAAITLTQELGQNFFGVQDRGNVKITRIEVENAAFTSLYKIENTVADVQKAYWQAVLRQKIVRIQKDMLAQARRLYELNQDKIQHGLVEKPELLDSEANFQTRQSALLSAENDLATSRNTLRLLLNLPDDSGRIELSDELSIPENRIQLTEALTSAFRNRYDYQRARSVIDARDIALELSRHSLWPEINLEASYKRNGIDDDTFTDAINDISRKDNPDYTIGLTFEMPLENTKARAEHTAAKYQKARALTGLKFLERSIAVNVKDRVRNSNILQEIARNLSQVAGVQEQKLEAELKRYRSGRSDTNTVIRFQEDVIRAQEQAARAKFQYRTALTDLETAQGTLLSQYWDGEIDEDE
ncbi:MAG: TolC family protein [Candidatus Omnitrophota bacterium]